jgi:stringent starvation protein B
VTPSRPYIIRAIYEWIVDNDCTPHLLVNAEADGVLVPEAYVSDGQIVLNISPTAVMGLEVGNEAIAFNGRFGGVPQDIYVPIGAVMGIYTRENGQGMIFESPAEPEPPEHDPTPPPERGKPALKIVK